MPFGKNKAGRKSQHANDSPEQEIEALKSSFCEERNLLLKRISELERTSQEYQQLKNTFISNISHEMRTPLNAILGFSELSQMEEITLDEMREYMKIIKKSSEQLLDTIRDIIYIASIDAGEISLQYDNISLKSLFQDLEEFYGYIEDKSLENGAKLYFLLPENKDVYFRSDFEKLRNIFRKLIDNSMKFTSKGVVEVGCKLIESNNPQLMFYVKDTGIGIPKEKCGLIFEPFRTVDESHSRQFGGSGLGLSIVKRLVNLLDGSISVQSVVGKGTTVQFSIDYTYVDSGF